PCPLPPMRDVNILKSMPLQTPFNIGWSVRGKVERRFIQGHNGAVLVISGIESSTQILDFVGHRMSNHLYGILGIGNLPFNGAAQVPRRSGQYFEQILM